MTGHAAKHRTNRSRRLAAAALAVLVAASTVAWFVGSRVRSADQAAASARPPTPSLVTAAVEMRVLSATVITRADVQPATSVQVAGPTLDSAGTASSGIVTAVLVGRGDEVATGDRVVEVAGRPVFVFAGRTPAYRTLRPGMTGDDVAQLQAGLTATGCDAGTTAVYDEATKGCVEQMYTNAGYPTVRNSANELTEIAAAGAAVADAEDALALAQNALEAASTPPSPSVLVAAQAAVNGAQRVYDAAVREGPRLIEVATRDADNAVSSARDTLTAVTAALTALLSSADADAGGVAQARAAVNDAQRTYDAAVADRPVLIDVATRSSSDSVASAADALYVATAALADTQAPADTSGLQLTVEQQQAALHQAQLDLTDLTSASGAIVPLGEIVYVPALPARVDSIAARVGQPANGSANPVGNGALLTLASPTLRADLSIPQNAQAFVDEGTPVDLLYEATGETIAGVVSSIGAELAPSAISGLPSYPAVVDADLPATWSGLNVRATFTTASTSHPVLVVPSAAVTSAANGDLRVQVQRKTGTVDTVTVTTGLSADGFVEVSTSAAGALAAGDRVVIG
ncbi:MAG: hypothetical protein ABI862_07975 [Ilumatobacteraceae bacterium]